MSKNPSGGALCFIGGGNVGAALAHHFARQGFRVVAIWETDPARQAVLQNSLPGLPILSAPDDSLLRECQIIFITVGDDQIPTLVQQLSNRKLELRGKLILHTSGAHPAAILSPLKQKGAIVASVHPIYSFTGEELSGEPLSGIYFDVEGEPEAETVCESLLHRAGFNTMRIAAEQKLPLHLAAVFYSNYFVGITALAQEVLTRAGLSPENHWKPFLPLIESTRKHLGQTAPREALTGPLQRGDVDTIRKHLDYLQKNLPELVPVYSKIAKYLMQYISLPDEKKAALLQLFNKD